MIQIPISGGSRFLATYDDRLAIHSMDDGDFLGQETFLHRKAWMTAINPNGDRVAVYTGSTDLLLWAPDTNLRLLLPVGNEQVNELRFRPDGKHLFALSSDGKTRVWDAESGSLVDTLVTGGQLNDIAFSPDAKLFAVTSDGGVATLYDAETLQVIRPPFHDPDARFNRVRFSFDSKKLITFRAWKSDSLMVWDIDSGTREPGLVGVEILGVAMHPSQPEAIVWSTNDGAMIWRYEENERLPVTDRRISSGAYSPDGRHFYLASWVPAVKEASAIEQWPKEIDSPTVTRWIRDGLQRAESIDFPFESIDEILVSGLNQVFVNASQWNQVVNHDVATHAQKSVIPGHYGPISGCLYTSDSARLITTSWDGLVSIWSVADGKSIVSKRDQSSPISAAAISRDDRHLVTGDRDGNCIVWSLPELVVAKTDALANSPIRHVALDREANYVLAISTDHKAHLILRSTGEVVPLDLHAESVEWAEFSPDGASILVIPAADNANMPTKEVLIVPVDGTTVTRHEFPQPVSTAHFHPDSKRMVVATGANEEEPIVWVRNARSGANEHDFTYEPAQWLNAVFDNEGEFIYVGGGESGAIWRISDGRRWLTVEGWSPNPPWHHTHNPFAPGQPRRVITRRNDILQYRDLPLEPYDATKDQLPRPLTDPEKNRFDIKE